MFEAFVFISLLLGLAVYAGILGHGYVHVRTAFAGHDKNETPPTAEQEVRTHKAVVIVPVTGNQPEMKACLESLLCQDYPDYTVFFVSADDTDPATALVKKLVARTKNARHILTGPATHCAQKNHNLLAGTAQVGTNADILIFCDSSHLAPPTLLSDLIRPMSDKGAVLTTGFHRIVPGDLKLATLGMLITVLAIHLLQGNAAFTQPWGGATAIRRDIFEKFHIDRLWASAIVDDFSMGPYLRRFGIRCMPVPEACMDTPLAGETLQGWSAWMTRQLLYLKFCIPVAWVGALMAAYLFVVPIVLAVFYTVGAGLGHGSRLFGIAGLIFLIGSAGFGVWTRRLAARPLPLGIWLAAFYIVPFMACWCYLKTWTTNVVRWKGISYRVAFGGKVREIISD